MLSIHYLPNKEKDAFLLRVISSGATLKGHRKKGQKSDKAHDLLLPNEQELFCKATLKLIMGIGERRWQRIAKNIKEVVLPVHGNLGKKCNKRNYNEKKKML